MHLEDSLEKLAQAHYGRSFKELSPFGQNYIRVLVGSSHDLGPHQVEVARALANAQQEIEALKKENAELWEENEELRIENLELTNELN